MSGTYEAVTHGVRVRVKPVYLPEQSNPPASRYAWAYTVDIENLGEETVQLLSRRWIITDAANRVEEVAGPGVVGEQPVLRPGDAFHYTSACPLKTPSGVMYGTYRMETERGELFDAVIPMFSLHLPDATHRVN
jgi:ApaG protein